MSQSIEGESIFFFFLRDFIFKKKSIGPPGTCLPPMTKNWHAFHSLSLQQTWVCPTAAPAQSTLPWAEFFSTGTGVFWSCFTTNFLPQRACALEKKCVGDVAYIPFTASTNKNKRPFFKFIYEAYELP